MFEISDLRRREILHLKSGCPFFPRGRGEGVLWYFHTYVGSGYFLGFKILNLIFIGCFFQKTEYFWGYEDFVGIFLGSSQNWTIFRGHF